MKNLIHAWLTIGLVVTIGWAQSPAEAWRAADPPGGERERHGPEERQERHERQAREGGEERQRFGRGMLGRGLDGPVDDLEWEEIASFMRENSPRRWELFERLSEDHPRRRGLMYLTARRYRQLQQLAQTDQNLFQMQVRRMRLEDEVLGLVLDLRETEAQPERTELASQLREGVDELFEIGLEERQRRIERLEQSLQAEKQKLADDQENREAIVDRMVTRMTEDEGWPMIPDRHRRPPPHFGQETDSPPPARR